MFGIISIVIQKIVGIDEAGRGSLAGPVSVGAISCDESFLKKLEAIGRIPDSKKLSPQKRDEWFSRIKEWKKEGLLDYSISLVNSETIDRDGISHSIRTGIKRNLKKLSIRPSNSIILLDGGLVAPKVYSSQIAIIKGDEKIPLIALASIVAKVLRDRHMDRVGIRMPEYFFEVHKGYGTRLHYQCLKKHGISSLHRKTFVHIDK
ncbi:ribonuclease HII [Candidatus Nomurabacteria bacterium]|nr:ribonuclease HII [Candidatus Nomurabacteria bacterium]USN94811.1 MAG: ribonuclease HII [Candidatus Nomurabacteria bacterium]